jgi:hypothetical protein
MHLWRRLAEHFLWTAALAQAVGRLETFIYFRDLAYREFYEYEGHFSRGCLRPRSRPRGDEDVS